MTLQRSTRLIFPFILSFSLIACGGGGFSGDGTDASTSTDTTGGSGSSSGTDSNTGGTGNTQTTTLRFGNGNGGNFQEGVLNIGLNTLSAGGTTTVTASIVDDTGALWTDNASIAFTSVCSQNTTPLATIDSPVVTNTGVAVANYKAQGCEGEDTITATLTANNQTLTATGSVDVQPAIVGSLSFASSTPASIGIRGVGLTEASTVKFIVKDEQGNPVPNKRVDFSLNTNVGDISLTPSYGFSGSDGSVETVVNSGTVATTVRVTATLTDNTVIKTQSEGLTVSTGVADQNSFSLSAETLNPEAWSRDNVPVQINILAADHFNNPVPDGSAIYFTTEGGVIDPQCTTVNGGCSVTWRSSNPRPQDGRATILATMIGEESFVDSTGNGMLDDAPDVFTDLGEAFLDKDEDGVFDPGVDEPRDFNSNGQWDGPDGEYNGLLCSPTNSVNLCSATKNIFVRDSLVLVMSSSSANIDIQPAAIDATGGSATATISIKDLHNQMISAGSTVEISLTGGGTITTPTSFTVPSSNDDPDGSAGTAAPLNYGVTISADGVTPGTVATLTVTVTSPSGIISIRSANVQF